GDVEHGEHPPSCPPRGGGPVRCPPRVRRRGAGRRAGRREHGAADRRLRHRGVPPRPRRGTGGAGGGPCGRDRLTHNRRGATMAQSTRIIDLNADGGESFGRWELGADTELAPLITSINVACGWHAGDPGNMTRSV